MSKAMEMIERVRDGEDAREVVRGLGERGRLKKTLLGACESGQSGFCERVSAGRT